MRKYLIASAVWLLFCGLAVAQLGLTQVGSRKVVSGGCAEATTFLARTSGLNGTHTTAYTNLICGLVTDGIYTDNDILGIFATQDQTTALLNLPNNTFVFVNHGIPPLTFTADQGFTGGSLNDTYIDTGFNPTTASSPNFTRDSAHISIWNLTNATDAGADLNDITGAGAIDIFAKFTDNNIYLRVNDTSAGFAISDPRGHLLGNRSSSTARQGYQNASTTISGGGSISYGSTSSVAITNAKLSLLGTTSSTSARVMAMASIGASRNSTQVTNFYNRLRTYMTAVGVP